ncbi:MAG: DUF177 domain-containing protein [Candidatus Omnitrophica bacterium]|nr:DUF177 domain-containing protein [Candidatus Omnitrophota bacterium]
MKIKVDQIKDKVVKIDENSPAVSWDIDNIDIKFVDNIVIHCEVQRIYKELLVQCDLTAYTDIVCSRCLNNARKVIEFGFKKSYNVDTINEILDLYDDLREEILLNYPIKLLCKSDCKGLCSNCGIDLNLEKCGCSEILKNIRFEGGTCLDI